MTLLTRASKNNGPRVVVATCSALSTTDLDRRPVMSSTHYSKPRPAAERFLAMVLKTETCWLWIGSKNTQGYGGFHPGRGEKWHRAHRYSWKLHRGPIPEKMCVLHTCDNPSCVNPDHLWLGTYLDNSNDKLAKGRQTRGEDNGPTKLTSEQVIRIRRDYVCGSRVTGAKPFARLYGVDNKTIRQIIKGSTWKHLL